MSKLPIQLMRHCSPYCSAARALYETFEFKNQIEGEENARALFYEREF